jgi:hypothetical protein
MFIIHNAMYIECASDDINNAHQIHSLTRKKGGFIHERKPGPGKDPDNYPAAVIAHHEKKSR